MCDAKGTLRIHRDPAPTHPEQRLSPNASSTAEHGLDRDVYSSPEVGPFQP